MGGPLPKPPGLSPYAKSAPAEYQRRVENADVTIQAPEQQVGTLKNRMKVVEDSRLQCQEEAPLLGSQASKEDAVSAIADPGRGRAQQGIDVWGFTEKEIGDSPKPT